MNGLLDRTELARVLTRLTEEGWIFPVCFSAISTNGAMVCGRYMNATGSGGIIASHCPSGEFVLPMNMMVVDEKGQAALIKWSPDAAPIVVHEGI
ncbi:MAG TPA: hypothetical protein VFM35_02860 [Candidatus Binatia bacterium]|nr:hypothetical protein [Candidatus Binatia bacterium]